MVVVESTFKELENQLNSYKSNRLIGTNISLNAKFKQSKLTKPTKIFDFNKNQLWFGDGIEWLKSLPDKSVNLIFADPPYNIKKAEWDTFESQEQYVSWSMQWIKEASRILKDDGSLYICGFSEILADLKLPSQRYFRGCKWLIWHYKNKANLGNDWGRSHESILHFRKSKDFTFNVDDVRIPYGKHTLRYPEHPQADSSQYGKGSNKKQELWVPHPNGAKPRDVIEVPVLSNGMEERTTHPTQKPEELLRKIIFASSDKDDIVLDPFVGSGTTLVCAQQLGRKWKGCDNNKKYCSLAIQRLLNLEKRSIRHWKELDKQNLLRRNSIR